MPLRKLTMPLRKLTMPLCKLTMPLCKSSMSRGIFDMSWGRCHFGRGIVDLDEGILHFWRGINNFAWGIVVVAWGIDDVEKGIFVVDQGPFGSTESPEKSAEPAKDKGFAGPDFDESPGVRRAYNARMASLPPLGAHVSVAGGLATALDRAADLDCTAIQIFVKNANQWRGRVLEDEEATAFRTAHAGSAVGPLVAHASYLINLAAAEGEIREKSVEALADELARCCRLGVGGLVLHPGAHLGAGEETGVARVAEALLGTNGAA